MANARAHVIIGAGAATIGWIAYCEARGRPLRSIEGVLVALLGGIGGLLPDLLEPATNPNHRRFFHSLVTAVSLAGANHYVWQQPAISLSKKAALGITSAGYLSHLLADARTPKGLPFA